MTRRWRILLLWASCVGAVVVGTTNTISAAPATTVASVVPATYGTPSTTPNAEFTDVACTSPGNCVAVGDATASDGTQLAIVQSQRTGVWSAVQPATFAAGIENTNPNEGFAAVSCAAADSCVAVGWFLDAAGNQEAMTMTDVGGVWGTARPATFGAGVANAAPDALFTSVSCAAVGACTAAGQFYDVAGGVEAMTASAVGGVWSAVTPAVVASSEQPRVANDGFAAIDCATPGNCTAVGWFRDSDGHQQAMTESDTAGHWSTAIPARIPPGVEDTPNDEFTSVSCPTALNCTAAGWFLYAGGHQRSFIAAESNGKWATGIPSYIPAGLSASGLFQGFTSISCPSVGNCATVGWLKLASGGIGAVMWMENAGRWQSLTTATFDGTVHGPVPNDGFTAVSCATPGNCTAAGYFVDANGNREAMTASATGGIWSTSVPATVPADAGNVNPYDGFTSVDCVSPGNCEAAGLFVDATGTNEAMTQRSTTPLAPPVTTATTVSVSHRLRVAVPRTGSAGVRWRLRAGSLPRGVSLGTSTGVISGVPSRAGTYHATLEEIDGDEETTVLLTVKVTPKHR